MTRLSGVCVGLVLLALATLCASAASPKRVLMVFREDSHVPATVMIEQAVRDKLQDPGADGIEIYTEYLDTTRFAGETHYRLFGEYLREKYNGRRPDVILTVLTPAFDLAGVPPGELIPGVPVVFIAVNATDLPGRSLGTNVTGIVARPDIPGTLDAIFRLQPNTRRIVVIGGAASMDRMVTAQAEEASRAFAGRAEFDFWTNRPLTDLRLAVAKLPAGTVVLYTSIFRDVSGRAVFPAQAVALLAETASVPVYVWTDSTLGSGAIGGSVVRYGALGAWAGEAVLRVLSGAPAASQAITVLTNGTPSFDWRALRRWGISESRLPPGSVIQFRQRTLWDLYRWHIVGVVALCLLQVALIIGLLVNRAKRRQGEAEATLIAGISSKFVNLPVREVEGQIMEAERRICELLGLELSLFWQWSPEVPEVLTLTHLYRLLDGPPAPERMSANEHFPWCQRELRASRTIVLSSLEELPAEAARDRETFRHFSIKSALVLPLSVGGGPPVGALSFGTVRAERDWPDALVKRLQLVAEIFANALARKRADQTLRESEERLRLLIEQAPEAVVVLDLEQNRLVEVNAQAERLFGCGRQELLASNPQRFYTPEQPDAQPIAESMRAYSERALGGETVVFERTICNARGQRLHCEVRLVRLPAGERKLVRASYIDITEVKQSEAALREAQTTLNAIIDGTDDLIWSVDPVSFGLMTFNQGLRDYFFQGRGIPLQPGMRPEDLFPPGEYVQRWRDFYQRALQEGPFTTEYQVFTQNRTLQLSFNVLKRDGKVFGVSAFGKDLTERKRAELEVQQQRQELAHVARVSVMGELAASVAHELNQPLGAILSNAEAAELFLQQDPPALGELGAILADIRKDDERAGEVIRRMRSLLRKRELEREPLQFNLLVEDVFRLVSADAALRKTAIAAELSPYLPPIQGDRIHLQQVLLNLMMNALEAMAKQPPQKRRLTVRTRRASDAGVEVSVTDSGPGIEPANLPHLFEPFFTTKQSGIGMGLAIARKIVEAHQGRIWAENHPGGGAIFRFTLPSARGEGRGARGEWQGTSGNE